MLGFGDRVLRPIFFASQMTVTRDARTLYVIFFSTGLMSFVL